MEKQVKKLFIRTVLFFSLTVVIWVAVCLLKTEDNYFNTVLGVISLIPTTFYVVYAYKLNTALEIDRHYTRL